MTITNVDVAEAKNTPAAIKKATATKAAPKAAPKAKKAPEPEVRIKSKAAAPAAKAAPKAASVKRAKVLPDINEVPTQRLDVFVFGEGDMGELGLGAGKGVKNVKRPRLNPHLLADKVGVVNVAAGGMHVAVLTADNQIMTWGVNDQGACGRDTNWEGGLKDMDAADSDDDSDDEDSGLNPKESTPTAIPSDAFPEGTRFVQLAAGDSMTFALTTDGSVYGWGTFRVS